MKQETNLSSTGCRQTENSRDPDDGQDRDDEQRPSRHDRCVQKKLVETDKLIMHFRAMCIKASEPMTHLRFREISISKDQMLFACISGIEMLVSFVKFASASEQIPA